MVAKDGLKIPNGCQRWPKNSLKSDWSAEKLEILLETGLLTNVVLVVDYNLSCVFTVVDELFFLLVVLGLTPHSDGGAFTILLQVNEMDGLQVKKDGIWVPVKSLPDAFIVNIGDVLDIITKGTYRSIEHRATVNSEKERLSIATFYNPRVDGEIGPASSLITE
ncbi:protein SRG1-like [Malus domestica]|uniref:protein SRG1-like n=1 Tax=Malus domestica TaxID=3750 RepID=UPI0039765C59